jgi:hypothetical protein
MLHKVEDIELGDLEKTDWISISAINICKKNGLNSLGDIIDFYKENKSFKKLNECGKNYELELAEKCKKFDSHSLDVIIEKITERNKLKYITSQFDIEELRVVNLKIDFFDITINSKRL